MISKVLMVDDDPGIRVIAEIAFRKVGNLTAQVVESGRAALEMVHKFCPDVILLDVMMPEMDGLALFKKLKEDTQVARIPIIFITAKVQKQEVQSYYNLGAAGVIIKPFDPITLPQEIQQIAEHYLAKAANDKA